MDAEIGNDETVKSELDLFTGPSFQNTHLKSQWERFMPTHQYNSYDMKDTPITIDVPRAVGIYTDLSASFMVVQTKIVKKADGTAFTAGSDLAFTQLAIHSIFKDVSMYINGTKVEGENHTYPYKAYLSNLFCASETVKKYQLRMSGWANDTAGLFSDKSNAGHVTRKAWTDASASTFFAAPLWIDCWMQEKLLTDDMDLCFKFQRADPLFCFQNYTSPLAEAVVVI